MAAPSSAPESGGLLTIAWRVFRVGLGIAPLFVVPILLLLLDRADVVELDERFSCWGTCHVLLIANLALYWVVTSAVAAGFVHRRAVIGFCRRRRGALIAMAASGVFGLVAAEVALRSSSLPVSVQEFRWPGSRDLHHTNLVTDAAHHRGVFIRTNADGHRTGYTPEQFRQHQVRVVTVGDSFLFGPGVEEPGISTSVLERGLRERAGGADVAVLNTGVASYSPLLQRAAFPAIVRDYRPTVTLLFLDPNDIGDDYKYAQDSVSGDPGRPEFEAEDYAPVDSALLRLLEPLLFRVSVPFTVIQSFTDGPTGGADGYYDFHVNIGGVEETNRWFILRHPLELTRPHFDRTFSYVKDIAAEARSNGSEFVLVICARYFHWSDRECPRDFAASRYRHDEPHEMAIFEYFESVRDQVDFRIFSLLPAFEASEEFPLVFDTDPHWNAAGHQVVGEALADYLSSEGLVGR